MKKKKSAQSISTKKTIRIAINLQIVKHLKDITENLGPQSKDLTKAIEKGAKKLAKKIAKEIKPLKENAAIEDVKSNPPVPAVAAKKLLTATTPTPKPVVIKKAAVKVTSEPAKS